MRKLKYNKSVANEFSNAL